MWELSARKIRATERAYDESRGSPVFTVERTWTSRGWTEWTQGFQYGSALLQFDATGEQEFLAAARREDARAHGAARHAHGRARPRLQQRQHLRHPPAADERGAHPGGRGGAGLLRAGPQGERRRAGPPLDPDRRRGRVHLLLQRPALAVRGHHPVACAPWPWRTPWATSCSEENDRRVSLLERLVQHAAATARYSVYYGEGRDAYDVPGQGGARVDLQRATTAATAARARSRATRPSPPGPAGWRGRSSGSPSSWSSWDRSRRRTSQPRGRAGRRRSPLLRRALQATADFYLANTAADGIPYWDTGAPGLAQLGDWRERPADPFNDHEPVDSSAAAIACQGLMRFGSWLRAAGEAGGERYLDAGLAVLARLLEEPYLGADDGHQGLLLHSVYHRPNGWDHVPAGRAVPCGESSMWGDYHLREAALHAQRLLERRARRSCSGQERTRDDHRRSLRTSRAAPTRRGGGRRTWWAAPPRSRPAASAWAT